MMPKDMAALINALPLAVMVVGDDDRVRAVNAPLEAMLGQNLLGKHHITALRQPAILDAIMLAREGAMPVTAQYMGREGDRDTTYRVVVAPADGNIVISFEDRTATEYAGQMRRDFVANVSHELRTPLTALLGFIETLGGAARNDDAARDRFLAIMTHEANRMTRLVDDLLSLSRVEDDERVRPRGQVDIGELLESVIKGLEPQAASADMTVTLEQPDQNVMVPGDHGQLVQVFTNLVENAIKYGASGGNVVVSLSPQAMHQRLRGEGVEIVVADQGEGIPAHHIPRLTERFYRVDSHRSRAIGGTGLGLAIVKHIVNRHRGRFSVESKQGQGTRVHVLLPTEPGL
ncbi:sensor histidine kinase [Yoonia sp.]|uniref:sensor histidine kinase n=1 Tax=Yoonia sp. TaxID=2212373 RepID=UPI003F6D89AB